MNKQPNKPSVASRVLTRLRELVDHVDSGKPLSPTFRTTKLRQPRGWKAFNERRGELIRKNVYDHVSEGEASELAFLQYVVSEYCSATFPMLTLLDEDELRILEEALQKSGEPIPAKPATSPSPPRRPAIGTPSAIQARCLREGHDSAKAGKFPPKCPYGMVGDTPNDPSEPTNSAAARWFEGYWLWFGVTRKHVEVMKGIATKRPPNRAGERREP